MKYGQGFSGATYDYGCAENDRATLCAMLAEKRVESVELHSFEKTLSLDARSEIRAFARGVRGANACVAKIFTGPWAKESFEAELSAMKRVHAIFGKRTERLTTLTSLRLYGFNFVAARVRFADRSKICVVFSHKCDSTLESTNITRALCDRFATDACEALAAIQTKNFAHCDLKPDNIIYCSRSRRFKLIDWGLAKPLKFGNKVVSTTGFGCPLAHYLSGTPAFVARRLMSIHAWWNDRSWSDSRIFRGLDRLARREFDEIVASGEPRESLFERYNLKFDLFSIGMCVAHCVDRFGLDWNRYSRWVERAVSMRGFADASEALRAAKFDEPARRAKRFKGVGR